MVYYFDIYYYNMHDQWVIQELITYHWIEHEDIGADIHNTFAAQNESKAETIRVGHFTVAANSHAQ